GKDRYKVREMVVEDMADLGCFEAIEDRKIPLKHSDRSKTPVEPYLSDQWFVKMGPHTTPDGREVDLAQSALDAVNDNRVRFYPSRYAKTYLDWLGEKRDWCISRQLWWGHRIPIWTATLDVSGECSTEEEYQAYVARCDKVRADAKAALENYLVAANVGTEDFAIEIESATIKCCAGTQLAESALN
ncbi:MAG: class I tRNA ligase family protein, partial [Phycisphaerales bacterium]|nr:class I tRNA ligase family protein [Phycisphaerales bacterium]